MQEAQAARETLSDSTRKIYAHTRRKLVRSIESRSEIEALMSTQDQIEGYGAELWRQEFQRLSEIDSISGIALQGDQLQWYVWKQLPDGAFKRFQQAFCHPKDFVIPRAYVPSGSKLTWMMPGSVQGCLARPDAISDSVVSKLRLGEIAEQQDDLDNLRAKKQLIPRLKMLWDATTSIAPYNHRVRVVSPAIASIQARYQGIEPPESDVMGSMIYLRNHPWLHRGDQTVKHQRYGNLFPPRRLEVQVFTDAYDALAREGHITQQYEQDETPELESVQQMIHSVNRTLAQEWTKHTSAEAKRDAAEFASTVASGVRGDFERVVDPHKNRAVEALIGMQGSLERNNVSAAMSKTVAARNALHRRTQTIHTIQTCTEKDRLAIEDSVKKLEAWCIPMRANIQKGASMLADGRMDATVLRTLTPDLSGVRAPLLQPFQSFVSSYDAIVRSLTEALQQKNIERCQNLALRMHVIGKLQALHTCISRVKLLTIGGGPSVATAHQYMQKIVGILEAREIEAPEVDPFVQGIFAPIEANARVLLEIVQRIAAGGTDVRQDAIEEMKQCIEAMSLPEAAQAIAGINGHGTQAVTQ